MTLADIIQITAGKLIQHTQSIKDEHIQHLLTDSRKMVYTDQSVFIAISGNQHDGHEYLKDAADAGVKNFIIDAHKRIELPPNTNIIAVEDSLNALQKLAAWHRQQFTIPIVGITGSNGKTIVKEWLFYLLQEHVRVLRSPKSYNSQVGVPLSVWQLNTEHQIAFFEAGISQPNEMQYLEKMIRPNIGILTNIGSAHAEGFVDTTQKIQEKLKLFSSAELVIYPNNNEEVEKAMSILKSNNPALKTICWSLNNAHADIQFQVDKRDTHSQITLQKGAQKISVQIPFTDDASIQNACTCFTFLLSANITSTDVLARFSSLEQVEMRLQMKEANHHSILINDSYNSDLQSLQIAIDFMDQQSAGYEKCVILSDIYQSGMDASALYKQIANLIQRKSVKRFIGVGKIIPLYKHLFDSQAQFFESTDELLHHIQTINFRNQIILLKGSRAFAFEKISNLLEKKVHETVFEINLNSLVSNLNVYRHLLQPGVKLMGMVKAFSYGIGSYEIAKVLEFHRVNYLAVAYADEGVRLREAGIKLPIMVMNPEASALDQLFQHNLEPVVYHLSMLQLLNKYSNGAEIGIHIEVDTGMKRLGFDEKDLPVLVSALKSATHMRVKSIFAHLAASEEPHHDAFTLDQINRFENMATKIETAIGYTALKHTLNSSGITRFPKAQFDMVRLGIGLYGIDPSHQVSAQLQPIGTLKTVISQIRKVSANDSIGYSRNGKLTRDSVIATVAIGYADGYNRKLGKGQGEMLVNGKRAKVVGSVCMDMTMLDVTDIECSVGDDVVVFGKDLPVEELARLTDTIPYEVLTSISQRVKRVYYSE